MNSFLYNEFLFSSRYRVWRHLLYWSFHICLWAGFWLVVGVPLSYARHLLNMTMWVPVFIFFSYPLVYIAVPHLLLKGKLLEFFLVLLAWGGAGLYIDAGYREFVLIPAQEAMGLDNILPRGPLAFCYLCMTTSAASPMVIKFFKMLTLQQREWLYAEQEKVTAELQLLKAQVHPHFLFNTLNNIYSFSMEQSPKTPTLIVKLSSLISYMLYDCNAEEVKLEKEIAIMKNYIDLEAERYGNKIDISWQVRDDGHNTRIAPLMLLPFIENAFKHGTSEQLEKSWLSVDIRVHEGVLRCSIANSKNEYQPFRQNGIGIANVKKRLAIIYPANYELELNDKGNSFEVFLQINLTGMIIPGTEYVASIFTNQEKQFNMAVPA